VVVGNGGAGGGLGPAAAIPSTPGGNSAFGTDPALVAFGGGAGATVDINPATSGGSGGGGGPDPTGLTLAGASGTPGQGGSRRPYEVHTCVQLQLHAVGH
jgi:hypothetical protein